MSTKPLLPLREVVVFPHSPVSLLVGRPRSLAAVNAANQTPSKEIFLAAQTTAHESPDHMLQAKALVHEVYLRHVDVANPSRGTGAFTS